MQIIGIIRIFIKQLCFILFISCVFISHYVHATDYTISNGTTQTSRVTLTNNDTLTVDSGGEIDYTWPAVDADNRTFPEGSTTITNNGTIEGSCCVIDIRSSTNPTLINNGTINGKIAKTVFEEMYQTGKTSEEIVKEKELTQITDNSKILKIIDQIFEANPRQLSEYKNGKLKLLGFFVGQVMKKTKGQANPGIVNQLLKEKLTAL